MSYEVIVGLLVFVTASLFASIVYGQVICGEQTEKINHAEEKLSIVREQLNNLFWRSDNVRSGKPQSSPTSVRLDSGLWSQLLGYAERDKIKRSEAMNRAIEALISQEKAEEASLEFIS